MKRITIFAGHYGSGKTNIAVNYAINLKKSKDKVMIADLDIVNPYFRTKDSEKLLENLGIRLISSDYANSNVDVPAISAQSYAVTDDKESYAVIDVGGDDRGALALGRFSDKIKEENNYEMLFVINKFRPLTATPQLTAEVMREAGASYFHMSQWRRICGGEFDYAFDFATKTGAYGEYKDRNC